MSRHPWSAVPAKRSSEARLLVKLYALAAVAGLAIVSGPLGLLINVGGKQPVAAGTTPPSVNADTALASIVAADYLAGVPTVVPVASGVDPRLGTNTAVQASQTGQPAPRLPVSQMVFAGYSSKYNAATKQSWQLNRFLVQSGSNFYTLEVPTEDVNGHAVLASDPALMPANMGPSGAGQPITDENPSLAYGTTNPPQLPGPVTGAINAWAKAFASGDSQTLLNLTNASSGHFPGLGGFTVDPTDSPQVLSASWTDKTESTLLVQVSVVLDSTSAKGYTASNTYDLLVTNTGSENPKIVAWGPTGIGQLTPFGNNSNLP